MLFCYRTALNFRKADAAAGAPVTGTESVSKRAYGHGVVGERSGHCGVALHGGNRTYTHTHMCMSPCLHETHPQRPQQALCDIRVHPYVPGGDRGLIRAVFALRTCHYVFMLCAPSFLPFSTVRVTRIYESNHRR